MIFELADDRERFFDRQSWRSCKRRFRPWRAHAVSIFARTAAHYDFWLVYMPLFSEYLRFWHLFIFIFRHFIAQAVIVRLFAKTRCWFYRPMPRSPTRQVRHHCHDASSSRASTASITVKVLMSGKNYRRSAPQRRHRHIRACY